MRQLSILVSQQLGHRAFEIAQQYDARQLSKSSVEGREGPLEQVNVIVPNQSVGSLLDELENALPEAEVSLQPSATLSLRLPTDDIPKELTEVESRSAIEVFLAGVQSIGSWSSFLSYSVVAGVIVWIGLYTNSVVLLVASMLIAPFGGPAMNAAISTARGDFNLLKRSLLRYFVALAVMVAVTGLLSLLFGQTVASAQMTSTSEVSSTAVLLPLFAGAAGAIQLVQSERSSLVSGTAIGMLVAAALAPPAGLIGMALAIGRPEMAMNGVFLLLLQLAAINLSCATVFRLYGLDAKGAVYQRGQKRVFPIALSLSALALALLLGWQFSNSPNLNRDSRLQRAASVVQRVVDSDAEVSLIESDVRFTRPSIPNQDTLLGNLYVQPNSGYDVDSELASSRLTRALQSELLAEGFEVTPLFNVTVLEPPE